jgi:hypothetical protein
MGRGQDMRVTKIPLDLGGGFWIGNHGQIEKFKRIVYCYR